MLGRHTGFNSDVLQLGWCSDAPFWLFPLNGFRFVICGQYKDHTWNISRINNATNQASVCIFNPVCSLRFVPSLRLIPICSLHFILTVFVYCIWSTNDSFFFRFSLKLHSFLPLSSVCSESRLRVVVVLVMKQLFYSGLLHMKWS